MKFHEITLPVHEPARWTSWFETTLRRLGAARTGDTGDTVQLGWTSLRFAPGASDAGERGHHLAFAIPTGTIGDAASSIVTTTGRPLLELDDDGTTVIERGGNWASRSVYFTGPENSVLELIEHADRPALPFPQDAQDAQDAPTLLGVAEIGRGVADVAAAGDDLAGRHDGRLPHGFGDPARRVIAAYGDIDGAVVLARDDRPWYPTCDVLPATAEASFRGVGRGTSQGIR